MLYAIIDAGQKNYGIKLSPIRAGGEIGENFLPAKIFGSTVITQLGLTCTTPRQRGYVGRLCHNGASYLVPKGPHRIRRGAEEDNVVFHQQFRKLGVFRGVAPPSPDCLDRDPLGYVENEVHIGVVVVVGAARDRDEVVS